MLLCFAASALAGALAGAQDVGHPAASVVDLRPGLPRVPRAFFGIHIHRAVADSNRSRAEWPFIGAGSWRLWDSYVSWADLERQPGVWQFQRLDSLVALARAHHVALYLTLGRTPSWASLRPSEASAYGPGEQAPPADIATWISYVDTVTKRYRGRIAAYELWNEPNMPGFFSGSTDELLTLARAAYTTIKRNDRAAVVITPSPSGGMRGVEWLSDYLAVGGSALADVVGFHTYATSESPEALLPSLVAAVQLARSSRGGMPLWITEVGWFIQNSDRSVVPSKAAGAFDATVIPDTLGAAFVARTLILARCAGAERVMWYAWDNQRMGLLEPDLTTRKASARAYASAASWLSLGNVRQCRRNALGQWTVSVSRGGRESRIVWNDAGGTVGVAVDALRASAIGDILQPERRRKLFETGMPFRTVVEQR